MVVSWDKSEDYDISSPRWETKVHVPVHKMIYTSLHTIID